MRKSIRVSLIGLWILFASGFLTRMWLTKSELFPRFPEPLAIWILERTDLPKGDVAILVGLTLSLIIVSALTLLGFFLWRRVQNALINRASGHAKARR